MRRLSKPHVYKLGELESFLHLNGDYNVRRVFLIVVVLLDPTYNRFPDAIPSGTDVPVWAYLDVTTVSCSPNKIAIT